MAHVPHLISLLRTMKRLGETSSISRGSTPQISEEASGNPRWEMGKGEGGELQLAKSKVIYFLSHVDYVDM